MKPPSRKVPSRKAVPSRGKQKRPPRAPHPESSSFLTRTREKLVAVQKTLAAQHETLMASRAQLSASHDRYAQLFYFAPVGYVTLNRAGQIVEINHAAARMLGEHRAMLTASYFMHRVLPADAARFTRHLRHCGATSGEVTTELRLLRQGGGSFPAQVVTAAASDGETRRQHFRTTLFDLTAIRQAEEELRQAKDALEIRVQERTAELYRANQALHSEIAERKKLEREIARVSEHERRRFGQDLHDDLCQQLTGIALHAQSIAEDLKGRQLRESSKVAHITQLLNRATEHARLIARGLHPVDLDRGGLLRALQRLVSHGRPGPICSLQADAALPALSREAALALYRITQEAVHNALKHAGASHITVHLKRLPEGMALLIEDDGRGIPKNVLKNDGMGLHIMAYRAKNIGASFAVENLPRHGGVRVTCLLPLSRRPASRKIKKKRSAR